MALMFEKRLRTIFKVVHKFSQTFSTLHVVVFFCYNAKKNLMSIKHNKLSYYQQLYKVQPDFIFKNNIHYMLYLRNQSAIHRSDDLKYGSLNKKLQTLRSLFENIGKNVTLLNVLGRKLSSSAFITWLVSVKWMNFLVLKNIDIGPFWKYVFFLCRVGEIRWI